MGDQSLFIATPLHDGKVSHRYLAGALQAMTVFADRVRFEVQIGSFLPISRDALTARFLDSQATHMLCIDSDIGWRPDHAQALLDTGREFVAGCYAQKTAARTIPAKLTGNRDGILCEAEHVPAGFLLLARATVERMVGAYRHLRYIRDGAERWALWASLFEQGRTYAGEDVAFCERWRAIGGRVWLHPGVVLEHVGDHVYLPEGVA